MPRIASAIKRARQTIVRTERLRPYRTHMKTMLKKIATLKKDGKLEEARALLPAVYKSIDTAAKKNILQRNTAARKKSLVARMVK